MIWFISACAFISIIMLVFFAIYYFEKLSLRYKERFTKEANANLTELFIFINPVEIYILNIIVLIAAFFSMWYLTGVVPLAVITSIILGISPRFIWKILRDKRHQRFLKALPDALNSISNMMRAGANLNVALETVVSESRGPVSDEFGLFLRELKIGVEHNHALDNLTERIPLEELKLVTSAMKISREIGGSLADVLERLGETLRRKIEMEGKIKALTAQGKAQGYVMTSLPVVCAFALMKMEPEAMSRLFTEWFGCLACVVFFVFLTIGYIFIRKIVSIDV